MKTEKNRIIPERRNYDEKMNEDDEAAAAIFSKLTNKGNFGEVHCMYTWVIMYRNDLKNILVSLQNLQFGLHYSAPNINSPFKTFKVLKFYDQRRRNYS